MSLSLVMSDSTPLLMVSFPHWLTICGASRGVNHACRVPEALALPHACKRIRASQGPALQYNGSAQEQGPYVLHVGKFGTGRDSHQRYQPAVLFALKFNIPYIRGKILSEIVTLWLTAASYNLVRTANSLIDMFWSRACILRVFIPVAGSNSKSEPSVLMRPPWSTTILGACLSSGS